MEFTKSTSSRNDKSVLKTHENIRETHPKQKGLSVIREWVQNRHRLYNTQQAVLDYKDIDPAD
jgi:hypothetical protein